MKTNLLGYPRIGSKRELKKSSEAYWKHDITLENHLKNAKAIRQDNWIFQDEIGIDLIPSNDFSLYDHVLDLTLTLGCIPERYNNLKLNENPLDLYYAMARGIQKEGLDVTAMEMTKWFDTNYHYIVPEFHKNQTFELLNLKAVNEFKEALELGIKTKPVLIGPVTFLLLGKETEHNFHRIELLDKLLPVYFQLVEQLINAGAEYIQFDEPCLVTDLSITEQQAITKTYITLASTFPNLKIILANYFDCYGTNLKTVLKLPVHALHLDLVRCTLQLDDILNADEFNKKTILSLGVIDGRNIWKNDFEHSLKLIKKAVNILGKDSVWIGSSCSLLHSPIDLNLEQKLPTDIKQWLAFAKQKVEEIVRLKALVIDPNSDENITALKANKQSIVNKSTSELIHNETVKHRVSKLTAQDSSRQSAFKFRQSQQKSILNLPLFPTTTIGSFPQTKSVRSWRSKFKKGEISQTEYNQLIQDEIEETIRFQESIGLDVLVHGEFERNDMVEYFGEQLKGFAFTNFGWVQSYGSRCVKPPIIFGDVSREHPMTVNWTAYAQSLTDIPVKGMLTGPVTILQWSFVRNDQSRATTCKQIALAIRDEVLDLESAGVKVIQIDEPAIREGLPLRKADWQAYLNWAIESFKISSCGVADSTQIHTHMCYSEFNDIIDSVAALDADVITIETSRSNMELLDAFVDYKYPNEIGPGVYDIHSPRIPSSEEIELLLKKACNLLPIEHIWVNPDCGLKTRDWPETKKALTHLVNTAKKLRAEFQIEA
ncbi:5-methyltetrahydropteroyltriglutamate--homocysteine S-methyltransferase [Formosa algae]|uniref:5-methyltetrahydropteroyltriglutamate-- homocysteine S-methyltransferase n=1 Tax=Formosa algae TaxID=225843 RepID=UPI000CD0AE5B|nr:5-methyltetrahydropteroyltriglutamate--homocysteine S-methyltransferase [Formosa algae]